VLDYDQGDAECGANQRDCSNEEALVQSFIAEGKIKKQIIQCLPFLLKYLFFNP
jgi:hypothetical protein